jgi:hypothetical protein
MSDDYDRDKLRAEAAKLLGFGEKNLTPLEMQCDLAGALMLELEAIQIEQLNSGNLDMGRHAEAIKLLRSLLPAATQTPPMPDFTGAREQLAAMLYRRADAIERREKRENEPLQEKIAALEAENERLRNLVASPAAPKALKPPASPALPQPEKAQSAHAAWVQSDIWWRWR